MAQFVADGVFYAELNELLTRELAEHGYSGVEVRVTPMRTEIIIRATRTQNVLGKFQGACASDPCLQSIIMPITASTSKNVVMWQGDLQTSDVLALVWQVSRDAGSAS